MDQPTRPVSARPPGTPERRAHGRQPCNLVTSCWPLALPASESVAALVRDISCGGAGLVVRHAFSPGTVLVVKLGGPGEDSEPVLARVVTVGPCGQGKWLLNCAFRAPLPGDLLRACLAEGG
jgi:hypothetical protein